MLRSGRVHRKGFAHVESPRRLRHFSLQPGSIHCFAVGTSVLGHELLLSQAITAKKHDWSLTEGKLLKKQEIFGKLFSCPFSRPPILTMAWETWRNVISLVSKFRTHRQTRLHRPCTAKEGRLLRRRRIAIPLRHLTLRTLQSSSSRRLAAEAYRICLLRTWTVPALSLR